MLFRVSPGAATPTLPQLNLHNTRVRRNPERLPSSRCIESAQSRRARVRILPIRASDTALRLLQYSIKTSFSRLIRTVEPGYLPG